MEFSLYVHIMGSIFQVKYNFKYVPSLGVLYVGRHIFEKLEKINEINKKKINDIPHFVNVYRWYIAVIVKT